MSSSSQPSSSSFSSSGSLAGSSSFASTTLSTASSSAASSASFTPPPPSQTGGGGGGGSLNGTNIASSASLYLYTFLATLILLLSVSGAIILRSFILRRRNRLIIAEAIRNGTWVPPAPDGDARARHKVDLSKKPIMWDAYVHEHGPAVERVELRKSGGGDGQQQMPWDWDTIRPFSAAYLRGPHVPKSATTTTTTTTTMMPIEPAGAYPAHISYTRRFIRAISPGRTRASQPYPLDTRTSMVDLEASDGDRETLRVAVLIAMPRQLDGGDTRAQSPSSSVSVVVASPRDEEKPMPLVEFGVTELEVKGEEGKGGDRRKSEFGGSAAGTLDV